tara:strand:- start:194 stop:868 length:675 start_codon:yes stop_codon:yes gene_type:complete
LNQNNLIKKFFFNIVQEFSGQYNYILKDIKINDLINIEESYIKNYFINYYDKSIFLIPINKISQDLLRNNWIDEISIKSNYKNSLTIIIQENKPVGIFSGNNNLLFDKNGKIIDLIISSEEKFENLILFKGKNSIFFANDLLNFIPKNLLKEVEQAKYINNRRWNIYLKNGLMLKLPEKSIVDAFQNYREIYKKISNDELQKIESIDLRMLNKAILKFVDTKND